MTITFFGVLAAGPDAHTTHPHCTDLPMVGWRKWRDRLLIALGTGLVSTAARDCKALLWLKETGIILVGQQDNIWL